jgi:AcrR family transcriptional regulator
MANHHNSSQPARDGQQTPGASLVGGRSSRLPALREARADLFADRGYRGTTMNDIAELLGVCGPSLSHHVASKHELLRESMVGTMNRLLTDHEVAVGSTDDVAEQLRRAAEAHVRHHARHRREAFVGNREIWSLEEPDRLLVLAKRDEYEGRFRSFIRRGVDQGRFRVGSVRFASYAILEMGIGVSRWFRDDGPLSEAQVAYQYGEFALRIAGANLPPGQANPPALQEA